MQRQLFELLVKKVFNGGKNHSIYEPKNVWIVGTPYKIGYPLFLPKSLDMYGDGETVPKLAKFWVRWIIPIVRLGVEYEN